MSKPGPTAQQRAAIEQRTVSVALSAGAGCGKTYVLTERFLSHLEPSDDPERAATELGALVAITFTERAAREMRERIRSKCYERLKLAAADQADYWLKLLRALDRARVSTIHSFCATLLRTHAVEARLDPRFAVVDAAQADSLAAELIDETLRRQLAAHDELAIGLVAQFGLDRLRDAVYALLAARAELADPRWRDMPPTEQVRIWEQFHQACVLPSLLDQLTTSDAGRTVLEILAANEPTHAVMHERRAALLELLPSISASRHPAADLARLREASMVQGAGGKKAWADEATYEEYKAAVTKLRAEIDNVRELVAFDAVAALPAAEAGLRLLALTRTIAEAYDDQKRQLGVLDFDDLIVRARGLLSDPAHARLRSQLAAQVRLLLVDEFQDTDPVQVELVHALCGGDVAGGKLFFVGDFKQSIYRFRGADPTVFRKLESAMPAAGRLPLSENFRSQPAILDFVNVLFGPQFGAAYEPLRAARPQVSPRPAVEFLWATDDTIERGSADQSRQREAEWIARRIREMLDGQEATVWDAAAASRGVPAARPPKLGDFAILLRALTDVQHYEAALQRYELDYYLVGGHAFYAQQEVFDLANLLRVLDNPADAVSLAGVLRSPFFSLADETLFWLAQHADGLPGGLWSGELPAQLDANERQRVTFAAETLRDLRARKDRLPVADVVNEALARTGYDALLLAEFLGERKLANLRKLIDQARAADATGLFGLSDFIYQLSQFVAQPPREPLAATHPESTDVIRLMSIHQSKGLEFPIVFVPDLERSGQGRPRGVEFSAELGPLVKPPDMESSSTGYDLQQIIHRQEEREEQIRLLYVACTRAADYLVLSSGIGDLEKPIGAWTKLVAGQFDLATGRALRPPIDVTQPLVRVTHELPATDRRPVRRQRGKPWPELLDRAQPLAGNDTSALNATVAIAVDRTARRQFSFSQLTGALELVDPQHEPHEHWTEKLPGDDVDPLSFGSLVHAMLVEAQVAPRQDIARLARRLAPRYFDEIEPAATSAADLVERFLQTPRAAQLAASRTVYSELDFLLAWPPGSAEPGGVYLQGAIDCLVQDSEEAWRVLDYKTNRVTPSNVAEVAAHYELQLYVYALAVEQVWGQSPRELVLHFLRGGLEHTFPWNDEARKRVVEMVERALAAARA